jgi:zinc transport system substrate-binding protein
MLPMLKASGNGEIVIHRPDETTPQIHSAHGSSVNSHTFISFTNAISRPMRSAGAGGAARRTPQHCEGAGDYARRLRLIKSKAALQLAEAKVTHSSPCTTATAACCRSSAGGCRGGAAAHGLTPSATELRDMVKLLQREKIRVVFSEETFPAPMLKVLKDEGGVRVYIITHIASGPYTADKFEREM